MPGETVSPLEDQIGFRFMRAGLLREALTHKSYAAELKTEFFNERLEFLGDSILSAVVAHQLYDLHPSSDEGHLSKRKSQLVSRPSLVRWARDINLGSYLLLGAGEDASGGRQRPSILCNALEALIGAIYLDGGFDPARRFILDWLSGQTHGTSETDFKSRLQEIVQKRFKVPPDYTLNQATGPDHDKTFLVTVHLQQKILGSGTGKSKKEAEQAAARDALWKLEDSTVHPKDRV